MTAGDRGQLGVLRDNWRVVLLVVAIGLSLFAVFSPTIGAEPGSDRATNLRYGLQLDGGTRVLAPLVGVTAEDVQFGGDDPETVQDRVVAALPNVSGTDVVVRATTNETGTVEVTTDTTPERLATALDETGYEYGGVRPGVTQETLEATADVVRSKINEAGLSGGTVQTVDRQAGRNLILIEVPGEDRADLLELVRSRGQVSVVAYHPVTEDGERVYRNRTVLTADDFDTIGAAQPPSGQQPAPFVPVTVRDDVAERVQGDLVETGVAGPDGSRCTYEAAPRETQPCLLVVEDGTVVNAFGMDRQLAQQMRTGSWADAPSFILTARDLDDARQVAINLRAGALPARLDVDAGTTSFVSPSQGDRFKSNSLLTGIVAVLAVAGVVFLRYGEPRVALPMIVTALSEVVILLGIAAGIGYAIDLSVVAGFVAVIGTGVDDLIIIADEVMSEGDVSSRRVFQSRFRKAFWVIGAAAATTIVAMSPLIVLPSLGDLRGFAIFTILGVLVGVLLTRPAYGDILRGLLTDR